MKKKIAMLLAAALCMGTFAGCGNSASNDSSAADNNTTNNTAAATESSDVTASADNVKIDTLNVYFVRNCNRAACKFNADRVSRFRI